MDQGKYAEAELVENRVAVLLFGGTLADRLAWATETQERLGGPLTVVSTPEALPAALAQAQGVVYLPNAVLLGDGAQQRLVQCLLTQEERPKLVVGLEQSGDGALGVAGLRPDLHYRLRLAHVNLDVPGLAEAVAARRAERARLQALQTKRVRPRAPPHAKRAKLPRRRAAAKRRGKPSKPRRAAAKRSRRR